MTEPGSKRMLEYAPPPPKVVVPVLRRVLAVVVLVIACASGVIGLLMKGGPAKENVLTAAFGFAAAAVIFRYGHLFDRVRR